MNNLLMHLDDTIVAIATPPGRGGIGVVRLSGPEATKIAQPMLRLTHADGLQPNRAHFGELIDPATNDRDRKSTRLNSSHSGESRMPSSA